MAAPDIAIVGVTGNTHVASSLERAARARGLGVRVIDAMDGYRGPWLLKKSLWWFAEKRPLRMGRFSAEIATAITDAPPRVLLTLGQAPVDGSLLDRARALGARCVNWSTDDPWNPAHRAGWHMRNLLHYDLVLTPRRANLADFRSLGCRAVDWLPFGYDPDLFKPPPPSDTATAARHDVLFVGGADADRAAFFEEFARVGPAPALAGAYWNRRAACARFAIGLKTAGELCALTAAASVNLCLVRRANRDGHVMRSFEIPAVGGFMIAEDTDEHREFFGPDGECVLYFRTPAEAATRAREALANPAERARMAGAARARVVAGGHTYGDRLEAIMRLATS